MDQKEEPGNGKSAQFNLEDLQRPDGIIPTQLLAASRDTGGVLATAMKSIDKNVDYRQELKTGYYPSPMKQMQMVLALDECRECGVDETLVVDLLLAQKAGIKGGFIHDIFEALTHTSFSTNYRGNKGEGKGWWRGQPNDRSPLS